MKNSVNFTRRLNLSTMEPWRLLMSSFGRSQPQEETLQRQLQIQQREKFYTWKSTTSQTQTGSVKIWGILQEIFTQSIIPNAFFLHLEPVARTSPRISDLHIIQITFALHIRAKAVSSLISGKRKPKMLVVTEPTPKAHARWSAPTLGMTWWEETYISNHRHPSKRVEQRAVRGKDAVDSFTLPGA